MKFTGYFDDRVTEYEKLDENVNEVQLSTAYDHNCSEQQTEIINDEMLDTIIDSDNDLANKNRYDRKLRVDMPTTDKETVKLGLIVPSAEEVYIAEEEMVEGRKEENKILEIFSHLTPTQRRRLFLMYNDQLSVAEIADLEGVGEWSIRDSIRIAIRKLQEHGDFLLETKCKNWSDLLMMNKICKNS